MTVVGTAWVELQAVGNKFASSLTGQVNPGLHSVGVTAEHEASRGRRAFGTMLSTITTNSNGALGPLQEVFEKVSGITEQLGEGRKTAGKWALGIGAAATGAGVLLTTLGDRDKIAMKQLQAAVEATGKSWDDYEKPLEKASKTGTHFGYSTAQTSAALNRLVVSTNDPNEAMKQLNVTMEIAASRHISLENAARMVGRVYGGSTMILRQFGITTQQLQQPVLDLGKAQEAQHKSTEALHKAQFALGKVEGEIHAGKLKGAKATWALTQAEQKLHDAQVTAKKSAKDLAMAHKGAAGQAQVADHNLNLLATRLHGQAEAAANTFTGRLRAMGAGIENTAASVGQKLGPALTVAGPILMGVGATAETAGGLMRHFSKEGRAARAMLDTLEEAKKTQAVASDAMTASQVALNEAQTLGAAANAELTGTVEATAVAEDSAAASGAAMDLALGPILLIGAAVAALGIGAYEAYEHFKPFRQIVDDVGRFFKTVFHDGIHIAGEAIDWAKHHVDIMIVALGFLLGPIGLVAAGAVELGRHWHAVWHEMEHVSGEFVSFTINDVIRPTVDAFLTFASDIIGSASKAFGWVPGLGGKLKGAKNAIDDFKSGTDATLSGMATTANKWGEDIGGNIGKGMAAGIDAAAKTHVIRAVTKMADGSVHITSTRLQMGSPSKVYHKIGTMAALGYAVGIQDGAKKSDAAAKKMAHSSAAAAKKAAAEHRKEMAAAAKRADVRQALGLELHGGARAGFEGTSGQINSTFNKVVGLINQAAHAGLTSAKVAHTLENSMLKTKTHLQSLAGAVATVDKKLHDAQANLKSLQDQSSQYASNVSSNIAGMGDIVKLSSTADVADALGGLQDAVTQAKQFDAELADLAKKGLSTQALDQIAQAGVTGGGKLTADTWETASAAQIQQANMLQAQLNSTATAVGNTAANNMYGAGIKAAQGLVNGLASQEKTLEAQMDRIAAALVTSIERKLKIHSPSEVFHDIGAMIPHGLANGIAANAHMVHAQLGTMLDGAIGSSASLAGRAHRVGGSPPIGSMITDPARIAAIVAAVKASLAASGHGGGQLPLLYVAGDLVVRSHQDIDNINRSLYVAGQNVSRAKG